MAGLDIFLNYLSRSSFITVFVLGWLSFYFIISLTVLLSRMVGLSLWQKKEQNALESLLMGGSKHILNDSVLKRFVSGSVSKEKLSVAVSIAERNATVLLGLALSLLRRLLSDFSVPLFLFWRRFLSLVKAEEIRL